MTNDSATKTIRAVERAVDVLRCFTRDDPTLSVTELQRRLGLSRPTLYRLLLTLERKGMVRSKGEPRRFELDSGVVALAGAWRGEADVSRAAQPFLAELWQTTGETVALFVPTPAGGKICVTEIQSRHPLMFTRGAGFSEPATTGSSGKVMLAFMPADEAEAALAGIGDARTGLEAELADIRRDGYAISSGEIIAGAIAIAAPVFDDTGIVASVCVFGPEARLDGVQRENCVRQVIATAGRISGVIGCRPVAPAEAAE